MFSSDMIEINNRIGVLKKDDTIYWFQGCLPVFRHHINDQELFCSFCCQLINLGNASSAEISRALGVNPEKLSRWARLERKSNDAASPPTTGKSSKKSKKKPMF
jgi:endogenous inhibitor of DNA gyrase (YacG/DUF329 family)